MRYNSKKIDGRDINAAITEMTIWRQGQTFFLRLDLYAKEFNCETRAEYSLTIACVIRAKLMIEWEIG